MYKIDFRQGKTLVLQIDLIHLGAINKNNDKFGSNQGHRAALRIFVVDEVYQHQGLGSQFLQLIEQWLKKQGICSLHDEARPDAVAFYLKNSYYEMPFNDPSGEPPSPHDIALGKKL